MPHITVNLYPGHTEEEKKNLAEKLQKAVMEVLHAKSEAVSVSVREVDADKWKDCVYDTQIYCDQGKLYIEPGYKM